MKYMRRTDIDCHPLQKLLNPAVLTNQKYFKDSEFSRSFSRELEKTFHEDNFLDQKQVTKIGRPPVIVKPPLASRVDKINCKLVVSDRQWPSSSTSSLCVC